MLLGFASFSELPFSTAGADNSVVIEATKNALTISIGNVNITADSIVEIPDPNELTLGFGDLTITGTANVTALKNELGLSIGSFVITADANVFPLKNTLTLSTTNVTVTGTALINPVGSQLVAGSGEPGIITWNDIIPGVNMTWTNIDPY
jgi:hypothetical protein|tara:strand:+ start:62 stop:511 length:450 start_codon:yes stop_codon:yes gene_type:complete